MSDRADRRRRSNVRQYSAEDQALNQISKEADQRLQARRAARAEAREIRLREIEKQQKEAEERQDKLHGLTSDLKSSRQAQLSSSRRNSNDSNDSVDSRDRERDLKGELRELEEKYRQAMMTSATLDNQKQTLSYQLDLLKDNIEEMEESHTELTRQHKDRCRELELKKRDFNELEKEVKILREHMVLKDKLIEESGFVIVPTEGGDYKLEKNTSSSNGPVPTGGAVLLSPESVAMLKDAGDGSLGTDQTRRRMHDGKLSEPNDRAEVESESVGENLSKVSPKNESVVLDKESFDSLDGKTGDDNSDTKQFENISEKKHSEIKEDSDTKSIDDIQNRTEKETSGQIESKPKEEGNANSDESEKDKTDLQSSEKDLSADSDSVSPETKLENLSAQSGENETMSVETDLIQVDINNECLCMVDSSDLDVDDVAGESRSQDDVDASQEISDINMLGSGEKSVGPQESVSSEEKVNIKDVEAGHAGDDADFSKDVELGGISGKKPVLNLDLKDGSDVHGDDSGIFSPDGLSCSQTDNFVRIVEPGHDTDEEGDEFFDAISTPSPFAVNTETEKYKFETQSEKLTERDESTKTGENTNQADDKDAPMLKEDGRSKEDENDEETPDKDIGSSVDMDPEANSVPAFAEEERQGTSVDTDDPAEVSKLVESSVDDAIQEMDKLPSDDNLERLSSPVLEDVGPTTISVDTDSFTDERFEDAEFSDSGLREPEVDKTDFTVTDEPEDVGKDKSPQAAEDKSDTTTGERAGLTTEDKADISVDISNSETNVESSVDAVAPSPTAEGGDDEINDKSFEAEHPPKGDMLDTGSSVDSIDSAVDVVADSPCPDDVKDGSSVDEGKGTDGRYNDAGEIEDFEKNVGETENEKKNVEETENEKKNVGETENEKKNVEETDNQKQNTDKIEKEEKTGETEKKTKDVNLEKKVEETENKDIVEETGNNEKNAEESEKKTETENLKEKVEETENKDNVEETGKLEKNVEETEKEEKSGHVGEETERHEKSGEETGKHEKSGEETETHEKSGEETEKHEKSGEETETHEKSGEAGDLEKKAKEPELESDLKTEQMTGTEDDTEKELKLEHVEEISSGHDDVPAIIITRSSQEDIPDEEENRISDAVSGVAAETAKKDKELSDTKEEGHDLSDHGEKDKDDITSMNESKKETSDKTEETHTKTTETNKVKETSEKEAEHSDDDDVFIPDVTSEKTQNSQSVKTESSKEGAPSLLEDVPSPQSSPGKSYNSMKSEGEMSEEDLLDDAYSFDDIDEVLEDDPELLDKQDLEQLKDEKREGQDPDKDEDEEEREGEKIEGEPGQIDSQLPKAVSTDSDSSGLGSLLMDPSSDSRSTGSEASGGQVVPPLSPKEGKKGKKFGKFFKNIFK